MFSPFRVSTAVKREAMASGDEGVESKRIRVQSEAAVKAEVSGIVIVKNALSQDEKIHPFESTTATAALHGGVRGRGLVGGMDRGSKPNTS